MVVPILDLRLSEFAPDRELATALWADDQLKRAEHEEKLARRRQRRRDKRQTEETRRRWEETHRAAKERETQLRIEAVKRGEVHIPLPPPVRPAYSASVYPHQGTWVGTGAVPAMSAADLAVAAGGRPVVLPPGYKLEQSGPGHFPTIRL